MRALRLYYLLGVPYYLRKAQAVQTLNMLKAFLECDIAVTLLYEDVMVPLALRSHEPRLWSEHIRDRIEAIRIPTRLHRSVPVVRELVCGAFLWSRMRKRHDAEISVIYCRAPNDRHARLARRMKARFERVVVAAEVHQLYASVYQPELVDAFFPISNGSARALAAAGIPDWKVFLARDGCDPAAYELSVPKPQDWWQTSRLLRSRLGLPLDKSLVGFTGHLYEDRGIAELLGALTCLGEGTVVLIVGGSSNDIRQWRRHAAGLGIGERVIFTGQLDPNCMPAYQIACDVLVVPYNKRLKTAGCASPLKIFEYMGAQRPIVATNLPCNAEVLVNEVNALLVPPDDHVALAVAIRRVLENGTLADKIARRARRDVEQYSWRSRAQKIKETLVRVAASEAAESKPRTK